ncbi:MAG TPA: desulfoferrodoxin [Methanoregulaceae archaeon]|nr:desulfoferrodoxin [Methanoregulaceae archaeon]
MLELYKCENCGKIVLVVQDGEGNLDCCQQPMVRIAEKTDDAGMEKHVPVIEKTANGIRIKVGAVPHPMEKEHYIKWIEVMGDTFLNTATLQPGDKTEMEFCVDFAHVQKVRIFCNVHGFWKNKP